MDAYVEAPPERLRWFIGGISRLVAAIRVRRSRRTAKQRPRGISVAMSDHLLRDIGLRRSELERGLHGY